MAQALALRAWAIENNGLVAVERVGDGYIGQEIWRIMTEKLGAETVARMRGKKKK